MTTPSGDITWNIVSQVEALEPAPTGQIVRGVRIYFKTSLGNSGSVFVPDTMYGNVDTVREMLQTAVRSSVDIHRLTGTV
jgi:hypothetical protein